MRVGATLCALFFLLAAALPAMATVGVPELSTLLGYEA